MSRRRRALLLVLAGLAAGLVLVTAPTASAGEGRGGARPVLNGDFPDPAIARWRGRWVSVATGSLAPRAVAPAATGPWTRTGRALARLPTWAGGDAIWASDLVRVGRGWLLYFSAPVRGLGPYGRCIGVALAPTPMAAFRPTRRPLVCPADARAPTAVDRVVAPGEPLPAGVIDPDVHRTRSGELLLTYRTQGVPSTIRVVTLDPSGRAATQPASTPLVASSGVVENPVLVERGHIWVLITSEGYFGSCAYRTTFRRADSLAALATAPRQDLVRRRGSRLCGPGGADLAGSTLLLHAWTCPRAVPRCRDAFTTGRHGPRFTAQRSLYAARLRWSRDGTPRIAAFLGPRAATGVVAAQHDPVRQDGPAPVPLGPGLTLDPLTALLAAVPPTGAEQRESAP